MKQPPRNRVRLVDPPDEPGRTTTSLLSSLSARLASLPFVSGADAIGSLAAGLAKVGREVSQTAEGRRLRQAIESGRAGINGDLLWSKMLIGPWVSSLPPAPVFEDLRNDLALLLTGDLAASLELGPVPTGYAGDRGTVEPEAATFADYLIGLWAFATEAKRAVEMLGEPRLSQARSVILGREAARGDRPELLR